MTNTMDPKKIAEIISVKNQCNASLEGIQTELLAQLVTNTNRIVRILESTVVGGQMELPLTPTTQPKAEAPEEAKAPVAPAAKAAPAKKAPAAKPAPEAAVEAPKKASNPVLMGKAEHIKLPTKDEVLAELTDFIANHPEGEDAGSEALAEILKELGGYVQFPQVPQEQYPALLEKINQA